MIKVCMLIPFFVFLLTLIITINLLKIFINISKKIKILDFPTNYNMHNKTVATGSGICFIFVYAFSFTIFFILNKFEFININFPNRFYIFNIILVLFSTMSFYDDLKTCIQTLDFFFKFYLLVYLYL